MSITSTQILAEANQIIKDVFWWKSQLDTKEKWHKAFDVSKRRTFHLENWDRWLQMFAWREVQAILNIYYWKKFLHSK